MSVVPAEEPLDRRHQVVVLTRRFTQRLVPDQRRLLFVRPQRHAGTGRRSIIQQPVRPA